MGTTIKRPDECRTSRQFRGPVRKTMRESQGHGRKSGIRPAPGPCLRSMRDRRILTDSSLPSRRMNRRLLRQGSGRFCPYEHTLRREPGFSWLALAKNGTTFQYTSHDIAAFAQGPRNGSRIGSFRGYSGFGIRFQIISTMNNFSPIVLAGIYWRGSEIIFKWLTVLYVDPQNLMTNRRKLPSGKCIGSEVKTIQARRYK
jgi:hypothetical protein